MAEVEPNGKKREMPALPASDYFNTPAYPDKAGHEWTPLQEAAARLYATGYTRPQVVTALLDHLVPTRTGNMSVEQTRKKRARSILRRWEGEQWFRDRIYDLAVVKTDLAMPDILEGVVRKAKRGRTDAAKLAMEVAGRYTGKGDAAEANVTVVFGSGLPRPQRRNLDGSAEPEEVEGEVLDED